ncbi:hypothetical protein FACS1894137_12630 [Spirochaetia bacterium]|nr:hypothetical protein FACS1894137_12630 [Spirochaetia bacterium]
METKKLECIESLDGFSFTEEDFKKHLTEWVHGIKNEYIYWNECIKSKGKGYTLNWHELISDDRAFNLEKYLSLPDTKFIDIGSGPFSSTGLKTSKTNLEFYAIDPLAYGYKLLKSKYKIFSGITPEFGILELLSEKYQKGKFDIVHMRNSLDHSFNSLWGILQMFYICKIGGKIILKHFQNEAELQVYSGFHQWNIDIDGGDYLIWRPGLVYNITKIFQDHANVVIEGGEADDIGWITVVIEKKKDIPLENDIQKTLNVILNEEVFKILSEILAFQALSMIPIYKINTFVYKIPVLGKWLRLIWRKIWKKD